MPNQRAPGVTREQRESAAAEFDASPLHPETKDGVTHDASAWALLQCNDDDCELCATLYDMAFDDA